MVQSLIAAAVPPRLVFGGSHPMPHSVATPLPSPKARSGNTQLVTLAAVVLVAITMVLVFRGQSPKPASGPITDSTPGAYPATSPTPSPAPPPSSAPVIDQPQLVAPPIPNAGENAPAVNTPASPQPDRNPLVFVPESVDFGYILIGQAGTQEVDIFNPSDEPITVIEVIVSCPCTTAQLEPETILPGEAATLTLTYTAESYPHISARKSVRLRTREFPNHSPVIGFVATIGREIRANPDSDPVIREPSGEFQLVSHDGQPFQVLLVDGREPQFVDFDPQADTPRNSYLLRYDIASREDNAFPRHLHVLTDRASDPMTEIITMAPPSLRAPLTTNPAFWRAENQLVQVGTLSSAAPTVTRTITLARMPRGSNDSDLSIALRPATGQSIIGGQTNRTEQSPPAVEARIVSVETDERRARDRLVQVEFTLKPDLEPGLYHDILSFTLPGGSVTELDVATFVRPAP